MMRDHLAEIEVRAGSRAEGDRNVPVRSHC